jgi:hypothetical protein
MTVPNASSIRALPELDRTSTPQIRDDVFELRAHTAEFREQASTLANRARGLHDRVQAVDLDDRASALVQNDLDVLLNAMGDDRGLPWSVVADLVGVSPTAVRKWRRGGEITPDRRARLARLVAFCQIVSELDPRIDDVGLWLQSPIVAGATTLTPADLFARGAELALLNRAATRTGAEELLDSIDPHWRTTTKPDDRHRVVEASDGVRSIVPVD